MSQLWLHLRWSFHVWVWLGEAHLKLRTYRSFPFRLEPTLAKIIFSICNFTVLPLSLPLTIRILKEGISISLSIILFLLLNFGYFCFTAQVSNLFWLASLQLKLFVISNIWQNIWKKFSTLCPYVARYWFTVVTPAWGRTELSCVWLTVRASHQQPGVKSDLRMCQAKKQQWRSNSQEIQDPENIWAGQRNSFCPTLCGFSPSTVFVMCDIWLEPWPNILQVFTPLNLDIEKHWNIYCYIVFFCLLAERAVSGCP